MKKLLLLALLASSCGGALRGGTISFKPPVVSTDPTYTFGVVACAVPVAPADPCPRPIPGAKIEVQHVDGWVYQIANGDGFALMHAQIPISVIRISASGFETFAIGIHPPDLDGHNVAYGLTPSMPAPPSRAEILNLGLTFQGLTVQCGAPYGSLPWFEASLPWLPADCRQAAYAAKRASRAWGPAGDTHALIFLPSGPPLYDEPGQPYDARNFPALDWTAGGTHVDGRLADLIAEVAQAGFRSQLLFLGGDAGQAGYPIAMAQLDLVHDALLATPYGDLRRYVVVLPGFDGVFYGYSPDQVAAYGAKCRALFFYCGVEHQPGRIPVGEGGGDYQAGGRMTTFDLVLAEFNGPLTSDWRRVNDGGDSQGRPNYRGNQIWQIGARMLGPQYRRPADQPGDADGGSPPFYLAPGSARGPFVHCAFEWVGLYLWVRGQESAADIVRDRQYFQSAGWSCGG